MTKKIRVTMVLDEDTMMKLRKKQAKLIRENLTFVSLSSVINRLLRENIKKI